MPSHWSEFLPRPACRTTASDYRTGVSSAIARNLSEICQVTRVDLEQKIQRMLQLP